MGNALAMESPTRLRNNGYFFFIDSNGAPVRARRGYSRRNGKEEPAYLTGDQSWAEVWTQACAEQMTERGPVLPAGDLEELIQRFSDLSWDEILESPEFKNQPGRMFHLVKILQHKWERGDEHRLTPNGETPRGCKALEDDNALGLPPSFPLVLSGLSPATIAFCRQSQAETVRRLTKHSADLLIDALATGQNEIAEELQEVFRTLDGGVPDKVAQWFPLEDEGGLSLARSLGHVLARYDATQRRALLAAYAEGIPDAVIERRLGLQPGMLASLRLAFTDAVARRLKYFIADRDRFWALWRDGNLTAASFSVLPEGIERRAFVAVIESVFAQSDDGQELLRQRKLRFGKWYEEMRWEEAFARGELDLKQFLRERRHPEALDAFVAHGRREKWFRFDGASGLAGPTEVAQQEQKMHFRGRYCAHFKVDEAAFEEDLLRRALSATAGVGRPILERLERNAFLPDRELLRALGTARSVGELEDELTTFQHEEETRAGFWRRWLHLSVSRRRLLRLAREVFAASQPSQPQAA